MADDARCGMCGHSCQPCKVCTTPRCPVCNEPHNGAMPHKDGGTVYQHDGGDYCHLVVTVGPDVV